MNVSIPKELLDQAIKLLEESKLMMNGGMFTLQDLPMPHNVKRRLVERSANAGAVASKLFAHTLKHSADIEDEIREVDALEEIILKDSLRYFDKKHKTI